MTKKRFTFEDKVSVHTDGSFWPAKVVDPTKIPKKDFDDIIESRLNANDLLVLYYPLKNSEYSWVSDEDVKPFNPEDYKKEKNADIKNRVALAVKDFTLPGLGSDDDDSEDETQVDLNASIEILSQAPKDATKMDEDEDSDTSSDGEEESSSSEDTTDDEKEKDEKVRKEAEAKLREEERKKAEQKQAEEKRKQEEQRRKEEERQKQIAEAERKKQEAEQKRIAEENQKREAARQKREAEKKEAERKREEAKKEAEKEEERQRLAREKEAEEKREEERKKEEEKRKQEEAAKKKKQVSSPKPVKRVRETTEDAPEPPRKVTVRAPQVVSSRDDQQFKYLYDLQATGKREALEQLVGKFVPLPNISLHASMKPTRGNVSSVMITLQMVDILKQVAFNDSRNFGLALVGPKGVGKSTIMYFVACWAFVNKLPLLYISSIDHLQHCKTEEERAKYLLYYFYHMNVDILDQLGDDIKNIVTPFKNVIIPQEIVNQSPVLLRQLLLILSLSTKPVIYIFDHYNTKTVFDVDANITGDRVVTLYSGTSVDTNRTKYIFPVSDHEFTQLLDLPQSPFCYEYYEIDDVIDVTGKIPEQVEVLRHFDALEDNIEAYCKARASQLKQDIVTFVPETEKQEFILKLEEMFHIPLNDGIATPKYCSVLNQLFYQNEQGGTQILSKPARIAVLDYLLKYEQCNMHPVDSLHETEKSRELVRQLFVNLLTKEHVLQCEFIPTTKNSKRFGKLALNDCKTFSPTSMQNIFGTQNSKMLLQGGTEFPMIIIDGKNILFIQAVAGTEEREFLLELTEAKYYFAKGSGSEIHLRIKKPPSNQLLHDKQVSIGGAILDMIYGKYGHKCELFTQSNKTGLRFVDAKGGQLDNVHYIFAASSELYEKKVQNILVLPREQLAQTGIVFSQ